MQNDINSQYGKNGFKITIFIHKMSIRRLTAVNLGSYEASTTKRDRWVGQCLGRSSYHRVHALVVTHVARGTLFCLGASIEVVPYLVSKLKHDIFFYFSVYLHVLLSPFESNQF